MSVLAFLGLIGPQSSAIAPSLQGLALKAEAEVQIGENTATPLA
jgi:hypothetical protein